MKALEGIRVVDLSRYLAGPYCSMLLRDFGARVIKVEDTRKGDDTRNFGPPFKEGESALVCRIREVSHRFIAEDLQVLRPRSSGAYARSSA